MPQTSGTFPGLSDGTKKQIVQPMAPAFGSPAMEPAPKVAAPMPKMAAPPMPKAAPKVMAPPPKALPAKPKHHGANLGAWLHPPKGKGKR